MLSDWLTYFYPQLTNPWQLQQGVHNLPWLYVVMHPLVLLGPYPSAICIQIATLIAIWYMCRRLGLSLGRSVMVFISPPVVWGAILGQFDGVLLLAYFAPIWIAPIAALVKPQLNIGAIRSIRPLWPYAVAVLLALTAFLIWKWPLAAQYPGVGLPGHASQRDVLYNWSFWPFGLLAAPALILSSDIRVRMAVSPFLFPYSGIQSLLGPLLGSAASNRWLFLAVWAAMWLRWWLMVNASSAL
jgi:hypothetical protein